MGAFYKKLHELDWPPPDYIKEKALWCEENNIDYDIAVYFLSSTAETDYGFRINTEDGKVAFKLRWS